MIPRPSIAPLGDAAVLIKLGVEINRDVNGRIHTLASAVESSRPNGVVDVVPAYASLAVHFNPARTTYDEITRDLRSLTENVGGRPETAVRRCVEIPTRYDGSDLAGVSATTGLPIEEIVERHTGREYVVYMIGFAPGFAYLGELDPVLHVPRRAAPRSRVPAGSVAIAGAQTAVYPLQTPGGWQLIGHTDVVMFDPAREAPSLLGAGDKVRFVKVTR